MVTAHNYGNYKQTACPKTCKSSLEMFPFTGLKLRFPRAKPIGSVKIEVENVPAYAPASPWRALMYLAGVAAATERGTIQCLSFNEEKRGTRLRPAAAGLRSGKGKTVVSLNR